MRATMPLNSESLGAWLSSARVLVIDDEPANLQFLRHVLSTEGYGELVTIADATQATDRLEELDPDLIIVDLMMPGLDGYGVMARVRDQLPGGTYLPILVATADHAAETRRKALAAGARDFLTKPLSPAEVRLRVRNLLETRFLHEQLRGYSAVLEHRVAERTQELEQARMEILLRLARAAEFRDDDTGQHTVRVGKLASRLSQVLGVTDDVSQLISRAAPLHDIGKIGIPDAILLKPGRLEPEEMAVMQTHTEIGANILAGSQYALLQLAEEIALTHHEHWNGGGYPRRLAAEDIPLSGRIVAVADVFDSLSHERPYKRAWTVAETMAEIEAKAGVQFDPCVVAALKEIRREAERLAAETGPAAGRRRPAEPKVAAGAGVAGPAEVASLAARLGAMEAERDVLAREVQQLRRLLARRETQIERLNRAAPAC
jgi:putative two-component system response regulator